jgi:hypothetical protein
MIIASRYKLLLYYTYTYYIFYYNSHPMRMYAKRIFITYWPKYLMPFPVDFFFSFSLSFYS